MRGGAATVFYPLWHLEVESLLVLKNNRGVEENRIRQMDYGVQINKTLYTRLIKGSNITLFSPNEVPGLYDAFFADQDEFERLYTQYEADESIRKKVVPAVELFSTLMQERASTGRIYIHNVDHTNTHSAFDPKQAPIHQSNLCVAGNTKVLTDQGSIEIGKNVGKKFTIWNGFEWSEGVEFVQTGKDQKLYRVTLSNGKYVDCTEYHKWFIDTNSFTTKKQTNELSKGDLLTVWNTPSGESVGRIAVESVIELGGLHDTFCMFEPKNNSVVFNDIMTGNCLEITLPTKPISAKDPSAGEIALCTLSAINLGTITDLSELEDIASITVRALDNLLDYQDYPVEAARKSTMYRRTLGVGVINFAYYLAKNGRFYSNGSGNNLTHRTFEAIQYYLLKASMNLAKERGACPGFHETTYSQGILPIDTYKKDIDKLTNEPLHLDWETLRSEIKEFGLRNSTLSALMPSECQSKDNEMLLNDGTVKTLGELLIAAGIDTEAVESTGIPTRMNCKPFMLAGDREVTDVYYNGLAEVYELEFEDGTYQFTGNHLLKVKVGDQEVFKMVKDLTTEDEIVSL